MGNPTPTQTAKPAFQEQKKRACWFCRSDKETANYRDAAALRPFLSDSGKIVSRRISGNCASHQRRVARAIKRARNIAVLALSEAQ